MEAREIQRQVLEHRRRMTSSERLQEALDLNSFVTNAQSAAVKRAHPDADETDVRMRVASRWVRDPSLLLAAFGWDVSKRGY